MHRHALPILASSSQIRSIATAAKPKPISSHQTDTNPDIGKWAPPKPVESPSTSKINKWAIPGSSKYLKSPSDSHASTDVDPFNLAAPMPIPSSSSSNPVIRESRPNRWTQKLSVDPPSTGLNKWARQEPSKTSLYSPAENRLKRDPAPHQDRSALNSKPLRSVPRSRTSGRWSDLLRRTAPDESSTNSLREPAQHGRNSIEKVKEKNVKLRWTDLLHSAVTGEPLADPRLERDLPRNAIGQNKTEKSPDELKVTEAETDNFEDVSDGAVDPRGSRQRRGSFKARGSLASFVREDMAIPGHSKSSAHRPKTNLSKSWKKKAHIEKKVKIDVYIPSTVSVGTLARLLNVRLERLQRKMIQAGMETEASYDHVLTSDYAVLLAEEFGRNPVVNDDAAFDIYPSPPHPDPSTLPTRPPIVTIMGHVDHGKTTLLDNLRSSSVAKGEAGGITQHIGAFSVPVPTTSDYPSGPQSITFLDTPGHAAFSAMRARGARITDIVVLVVAADDGVMPQTREVIELIKKDEGNVGVVVAINKVDKLGIDIENVQKALLSEDVQLEAFGGDIPSVAVSGLTGLGLNDLVETLSTLAEMQDLRAERTGPVHGYVLESRVHKGLGSVATVLILRGCLTPGLHIISGTSHGKVRVMTDSSGASVKEAYPGMAITVSGWKVLPNAGDEVLQGSEADVKKAVANRMRKAQMESTLIDVQAINDQRRLERERKEGPDDAKNIETAKKPKELRLVIKGDVSGSVEAVEGALQGIGNKEAFVKIVSTGVGDVSESDVMMAKAAEGMIVAFSVSTPRFIEVLAAQNGVSIYSSTIIYRLMDHIKNCVIALLPVTVEKRVTGEATVLQLFDIHLKAKQTMKVAGCRVTNGVLNKTANVRVVRDGTMIFDGSFDTMRHLKKDIVEVRKGSECGLSLHRFDALRQGDLIQVYQNIESPGTL